MSALNLSTDDELALMDLKNLLAFLVHMVGNQALSGGQGGLPLAETEELGLHAILRHAENLLRHAVPDL